MAKWRSGSNSVLILKLQKMETDLCAKQMLLRHLEEEFGEEHDDAKAVSMGLPADKYEASFIAVMTKFKSMEPSYKFVKKFLYHGLG